MLLASNRVYLEPHVRATLRWVLVAAVAIPAAIMLLRHLGGGAPQFCDGTTAATPCIYTVGFRTEDTLEYLAKSGTRVLAIEADPRKAQAAQIRFANEVSTERLLLRNAVVAKPSTLIGVPYWTNTANASLSGFERRLACPGADTAHCSKQNIPAVTCRKLLMHYGTPQYAAITDHVDACVESLKGAQRIDLPVYISVVGVTETAISALAELGYNRFKLVDTTAGTTAVWGEQARDVSTGLAWVSRDDAMKRLMTKNTANVIHAFRT